jgi:hypothetical protein
MSDLPLKVTEGHILSLVVQEEFTVLPCGKIVICSLRLKNGFTVIGEAGVVDKASFVRELGEKFSRERALDKLWELEGYLLQQRRFEAGLVRD